MPVFTVVDDGPEPEHELPKYSDRGRILFRIWLCANDKPEFEVLDCDSNSSVMWLSEGIGLEYFLGYEADLEIELDGTYVMEGVHGVYYRGDRWTTDDDEEWYFDRIRRASEAEIAAECLDGEPI